MLLLYNQIPIPPYVCCSSILENHLGRILQILIHMNQIILLMRMNMTIALSMMINLNLLHILIFQVTEMMTIMRGFMMNRNGNSHHKILKKKYQSIESNDDMSVPRLKMKMIFGFHQYAGTVIHKTWVKKLKKKHILSGNIKKLILISTNMMR